MRQAFTTFVKIHHIDVQTKGGGGSKGFWTMLKKTALSYPEASLIRRKSFWVDSQLDSIAGSIFLDILVEVYKYSVSDNNAPITTPILWPFHPLVLAKKWKKRRENYSLQYHKKMNRNSRERTFLCSITKKKSKKWREWTFLCSITKKKKKKRRENFSFQYHSADDEKMPMMCYHLRSCVPKLVKRSRINFLSFTYFFYKIFFQVWMPPGKEQLHRSQVSFL